MTSLDLMALAEEERADLVAVLRTLKPEQWQTQSLCPDWTVRDVAVHVVSYEELSSAALAATFLRGGLRVGAVNKLALARYRDFTPGDVIALIERHRRPRGLTAGFKGGIALTDGTIHQQDIRRPLGLRRMIPEHRLVAALDFSLRAPTLRSRSNASGLRLRATDIAWTHGHDGPEMSGPGEALLMAAAGRAHALNDLSGDGLPTLRKRITAAN